MDLKDFFDKYRKVALGFSGGADSSFLLYEGRRLGADIKPYYVRTCFQPSFEYNDALRMAGDVEIILMDILQDEKVRRNQQDRCYYCKMHIFEAISARAHADGYTAVIDGTNASDDAEDRPGMKALENLGVLSPLRMCGLTKDEIRIRSKEAGLFTWNKPAYACLATRITAGNEIDEDTLRRIEKCEEELMNCGFSDFRIRVNKGNASIYINRKQREKAEYERDNILRTVSAHFPLQTKEIYWR